MDPISAALFAIVVTWYGSKSGAVRSLRAVREGHRERKLSRPDPRPSASGVRAGSAVSAGLTTTGLAVRDFRRGWGDGWRDGTQRARDKRDIRRDQHDARRLTVTPAPTETESQTDEEGTMIRANDAGEEYFTRLERATIRTNRCPALAPEGYCGNPVDPRFVFCDAHVLRDEAWGHHSTTAMRREEIAAQLAETAATDPPAPPEPPADHQPVPAITLVKETKPMPEIASLPELNMWLNGIQAEATAELEDAQARQKRAADLATQIDHVLANLQSLGLSNEDLNAVGDLLDPAGARLQAAVVDTDAADTMVTAAETAATFITARHAALQEAVNETPQPASMEFYENGKAAA